jgi:hypothetical protein
MTVWPSVSHVAPEMHLPLLHFALVAQSPSLAQLCRHWPLDESHAYAPQSCDVVATGHAPEPSHDAPATDLFPSHAAARHALPTTKPAHVVVVVPSHCARLHTSAALPAGHAARLPCGEPDTGAHVPSALGTSHAAHWSPHFELQQKPSTHMPLVHSLGCIHAWPFVFKQLPAPSHASPAPHAVPVMLGANVHVPVASQPVHVSHVAAVHMPLQQLPLAPAPVSAPHVNPDAHSRHDAILHTTGEVVPAVVLHGCPVANRIVQLPAPLQKNPLWQSVSVAQVVVHTVLDPSQKFPPPQGEPAGLGENVHAPLASQPVHVSSHVPAEGAQLPAQQLPTAPMPVSTPQLPVAHSRQPTTMHAPASAPTVVLHAPPVATRETHVPRPLQ